MSLDLTHGFTAELHTRLGTVRGILASNFMTRHTTHTVNVSEGSQLTLWFRSPGVTFTEGGPAHAAVHLSMTARLSDRNDEASVTVTARGPVVDRQVSVAGRQRVCPVVDLSGVTAGNVEVSSDNAAYDAVVGSVVANLVRGETYAVGPLMDPLGTRHHRAYSNVPGLVNDGVLATFVAAFGGPPTPPAVDRHLFEDQECVLLVPDDLVFLAVNQARQQAGLGSLPADLNANLRVNTFDVLLKNGHLEINASGEAKTEVLGIDVGAGVSIQGFFQLLLQQDGTIKVHVIDVRVDVDSAIADIVDFVTAGAITRFLEEFPRAALSNLAVGPLSGLDILSRQAPSDLSAPATHFELLGILPNGLDLTWDIGGAPAPLPEDPPYHRGHRVSREFHVKGCSFGDLIKVANLRKFPSAELAIRAGYDGCSTCQPAFNVAVYGDLVVTVRHPAGVEPDQDVTVRIEYAGSTTRFGVVLSPDPEQRTTGNSFDEGGVPTHRTTFGRIVPAPWLVTVTCGGWSTTASIDVARRFLDASGSLQGEVTEVVATVGADGILPGG